jgi:hypothetical protein
MDTFGHFLVAELVYINLPGHRTGGTIRCDEWFLLFDLVDAFTIHAKCPIIISMALYLQQFLLI